MMKSPYFLETGGGGGEYKIINLVYSEKGQWIKQKRGLACFKKNYGKSFITN